MKTRVAIIHYWWLINRGGETVVTAILDLFPEADLYLHVGDDSIIQNKLGPKFSGKIVKTFISKLPFSAKKYQKYLPLMPIALEKIDLSKYDLIISSESGPAKGVITNPDSIHICYCHSPMRYIWDLHATYLERAGKFTKFIFPIFAHWLRLWDRVAADRVDFFVANSSFVKKRIQKFYRRDSEIIFPPVEASRFSPNKKRENYYLWLGQLTPYKRPDLMISAFNELGLPLIVIGDGEEYFKLISVAKSNIKFMGHQPNSVVQDYLEGSRALIFPGVEDFGIVPVEAMAAGAPVIAYARGGAVDTVIDGVTGILFKEQTKECLIEAILQVENGEKSFDSGILHAHAMKFDTKIFKENFLNFVNSCKNKQ